MNWGGFPVGFRFPVPDFSRETKARCWERVLKALTYADLSNTTLQEAESAERFDETKRVYIAIVSPVSITTSRNNCTLWRRDGTLMSSLCYYVPWVQENYLELFTKHTDLAEIAEDRRIVPTAEGEGLFPAAIPFAPKAPSRKRVLLLPKEELPFEERMNLLRQAMEKLYVEDSSRYLTMLPLSPGGEGTVYTAAAFLNGRIFTELVPDREGTRHRVLFGVTAGKRLLIDGFSVPDIAAPLSEEFGLGKTIEIGKGRGFKDVRLCARGLNVPDSEAKPVENVQEIYRLQDRLCLFDRLMLVSANTNGIVTESIDIDRRNVPCVSSIL